MLTATQLLACMPKLSPTRAAGVISFLNQAMEEAQINTPLRMAAFLAQLASLRYMEEVADGSAYEGRHDLGNTQPGDGCRYKGRGPIQLTGRSNYRLCGQALHLDLENKPQLASQPDVGFRVAGWFWAVHHLNFLADSKRFDEITHVINGGQNGATNRRFRYALSLKALQQPPLANS
jgi:predicted chitinase